MTLVDFNLFLKLLQFVPTLLAVDEVRERERDREREGEREREREREEGG
jgi:hypothetical protein